jgi:hypothetical protein
MRMIRLLVGVVGGVAAVTGVLIAIVGGLLLWADLARTDDEGFLTSSPGRLETETHAILQEGVEVGSDAPAWIVGDSPGTVRVRASSADPRQPIFIGIGQAGAVERYLAGVERDVVVHADYDPLRLRYLRETGRRRPPPPDTQELWVARVQGARPEPLVWDVADGRWSIVAMNADGSRGVALDAELGARIEILRWLGLGMLVGGAVLLAVGVVLIRRARRRVPERPPERTGVDQYA